MGAIDSMGLKDTLSGGEFTLLAPSDSAFEEHETNDGTPLTADILKYHVIEGKVTQDAIIGLKSEGPSKSSNWPSDVECSNGLIQAVDTVLVPGRFEAPPPDAY